MADFTRFVDRLSNVRRRVRYGTRLEARHIEALAVLAQVEPRRWVTWSGSSMRPAATKLLVDHVVTYQPRLVVELGTGVSTRMVARVIAAEGLDTRVLAIDADAGWCDTVRAQLEHDGVAHVARIVHAPLVDLDSPTFAGARRWYEWATIRQALDDEVGPDGRIDLLVIDGPAAWSQDDRYNRGEAVSWFAPLLASSATIFVDDALRVGERRMIRAWSDVAGVQCRVRTLDGVAIARTDDTWWI